MKRYHLANNVIGWIIGLIACTVYIVTAEATASWWDCGEYISTAFKWVTLREHRRSSCWDACSRCSAVQRLLPMP